MPPESKMRYHGKQVTALTAKDVRTQTPGASAGEIPYHVIYIKKSSRWKYRSVVSRRVKLLGSDMSMGFKESLYQSKPRISPHETVATLRVIFGQDYNKVCGSNYVVGATTQLQRGQRINAQLTWFHSQL